MHLPSIFTEPVRRPAVRFFGASESPWETPDEEAMAALIRQMRNNDAQAWLKLQKMFIPLARGTARFLAGKTRLAKSDLAEAAEHGMMLGIAQLREPSFNPTRTPVIQVIRQAISKEVQALIKVQRPDLSLAQNWGDEGGHFNPFTPLVEDAPPAIDGPQEASTTIKPEEVEQIRHGIPALGFLEGWALQTSVGMDGFPVLSEKQVGDILNLKPVQVKRLRQGAIRKIKKRIAFYQTPPRRRLGESIPYPHLKAIDRLSQEKATLVPLVEAAWPLFTPHEQKILSLIVLFRLTPRQAMKALKTSEDALSHRAVDIEKKLNNFFRMQASQPRRGVVVSEFSQTVVEPDVSLVQKTALALGLTGLASKHLKELTFLERELLKALVLAEGKPKGKPGLHPNRALADSLGMPLSRLEQMTDRLEKRLRRLTGQSVGHFRKSLKNALEPAGEMLTSLDSVSKTLLTARYMEGQTAWEAAQTIGASGHKMSAKKATARMSQAAAAIKKLLVKNKAGIQKPGVPLSEEGLCAALVSEGLAGVTPELLKKHLTDYQRKVLARRMAGQEYSRISRDLGFDAGSVKVSAKAAVEKLKKVLSQEYLLPKLREQGLTALDEAEYAILHPKTHRLIKHYFAHGYRLDQVIEKINGEFPVQKRLGALQHRLVNAFKTLPPGQMDLLGALLEQDVSLSELARRRNVQLTSVTAMVKAALKNLHEALHPFALEDWLNRQGFSGIQSEDLSGLTEFQQRLMTLYAKREYGLEKTVATLSEGQTPVAQVRQLKETLEKTWQGLSEKERRIITVFCESDYTPESLQPLYPDLPLKNILRDELSPSVRKLYLKMGVAPVGTRLRLRGLSFISERSFSILPPEIGQILTLYLDHGRSLGPLSERLQRTALSQKEAVELLTSEVERGLASLTRHQMSVMASFFRHRCNAQAVAKQFDCSGHSVAAALDLAMRNIEKTLEADGLGLQLQNQGLAGLTQDDVESLTRFETTLLTLYLKQDFSLVPVIRQIQKNFPRASAGEQLERVVRTLQKAHQLLDSPHQKEALALYCKKERSYGEIAGLLGIGENHAARVGPLLKAGLVNMRRMLEAV